MVKLTVLVMRTLFTPKSPSSNTFLVSGIYHLGGYAKIPIYDKLNVKRRTEAVAKARELGIL